MSGLASLLGPDGAFAKYLPGFQPRAVQVEMAEAVARTIKAKTTLIAEAGTGTGKTFAYLVPALLSGSKILVSTATRTLQDQLFQKDLPLVQQALGRPFEAALLKGRSNYLCLYRLENSLGFQGHHGHHEAIALEAVLRWSKNTRTGDIAEAVNVAEASPLWPAVTSTVDNCLGQECPFYEDCFLIRARKAALTADIVVVNHHLLWADWSLKRTGFGEILPESEVIVVDEAHQFMESAARFLGLSLSSHQFNELCQDTVLEGLKEVRDDRLLPRSAEQLENEVANLRLALGEASLRRETWNRVESEPAVQAALSRVKAGLMDLEKHLKPLAGQGKGLEACARRSSEITEQLQAFLSPDDTATVRWFETRRRLFTLNRTPLEVASEFGAFRKASQATWIFASATLTASGNFDHFVHQFGLVDAECQVWESPFDYRRQCLLYLPGVMPDPGSSGYTEAFIEQSIPVLKASRGRAFLLFTSHQALNEAARLLTGQLEYPLFIQGSQPKGVLLESFRQSKHGILLGTSSFWEGVDVKGPALSCVIIDKLPFASPGDPVLNARLESLKRAGQNPFMTHQVPHAIITLKQGVGRLIRDVSDRGVLMLADPRIESKGYGSLFLDSLPPMPIKRDIADVEHFFGQA
jgi:ATP-dependent DNA helicase DinG